MRLFSQVCGEEDIARAWLAHYRRLGVTSFHLVVHGTPKHNRVWFDLAGDEVRIEEHCLGPFVEADRALRLGRLAARYPGEWVWIVDADEFVELPFDTVGETCAALVQAGVEALPAPLLQRVAPDGGFGPEGPIADPFAAYPVAVPDLCKRLGASAALTKFPLVLSRPGLRLSGGNHEPPGPFEPRGIPPRGVTHHFKWRRGLLERVTALSRTAVLTGREGATYARYLHGSGGKLPVDGGFAGSRDELFARGMLHRGTPDPDASRPRVPVRWEILIGRESAGAGHRIALDANATDPQVWSRIAAAPIRAGDQVSVFSQRWAPAAVAAAWWRSREPVRVHLADAGPEACLVALDTARMLLPLVDRFVLPDAEARARWVDWVRLPGDSAVCKGEPAPPEAVPDRAADAWDALVTYLAGTWLGRTRSETILRLAAARPGTAPQGR
jgi:hypothetical protein